jgi:VIT1/CCC1 family predicted Fe2+/Mn2+ transporter
MHYSLSDIPDKTERDKSLLMLKQLFVLLHKEINRSNIYAALICSTTTFLAGIFPIIVYLSLPEPLDMILSLGIVGTITGGFLVHYRSKRTKVHWKITLFETVAIVLIAVIASLILGGSI